MNENLSLREREIISTLLGSLDISSKESDKDNVSAILSEVEKKEWTKYDFHELNIAARYFVRICEKMGIISISKEIEVSLPDNEQIVPDCYLM